MWIEKLTGDLADKKKYREYKARVKALPSGYREVAHALERYMMIFGGADDGKTLVAMVGDLADLLEQSAADALPIRDLVGEDPVEFIEAFLANYRTGASWVEQQRTRLVASIDRAIEEQGR
jgi:DNA-binding ferritin-like protein (Dps family)